MPPVTRSRSRPADAFFRFPQLPVELRCMIWTFTLPGPQVHYAYEGTYTSPDSQVRCVNGGATFDSFGLLITSPQHPVAMSVTKESRAVALRSLRRFPRFIPSSLELYPSPRGYYDPDKDSLHLFDNTHDIWHRYLTRIPFTNISKPLYVNGQFGRTFPKVSGRLSAREPRQRHLRFLMFRRGARFNPRCRCKNTNRSEHDPVITQPLWYTAIQPQEHVEAVVGSERIQTMLNRWTSDVLRWRETDTVKLEIIDLDCHCKANFYDRMQRAQENQWLVQSSNHESWH